MDAEPFQHFGIAIEDGDVGAHAHRHLRRVEADHAAADHQHLGGQHARHPAQQHAAPAMAFCSAVAPAWIDMRPATWLIGLSSGSAAPAPVTVS
jgi:hypothetical protein